MSAAPDHAVAPRPRWPLAALAFGAGGLWLLHHALDGHPLFGSGPLHEGLRVAAVLATALFAVVAGGRAVLRLGLSSGLGTEPTGLQRAIAYGVLTFAASAVVLASFGFDITAVLTTSAILTAAVGLAMQPTLGSLISGVALHVDHVLKVGDTIVFDDRLVEIVRLDWRTVVGQRKDGSLLVIPNSRISNETLVIHPAGRPARLDTVFPAPASVPPQRVTDLVSELIVDFPQVDSAFPVMVMVDGHEPEHAAVRYRARYWVRNLWDRPEIGSEVLRRIWYAYQRNGIDWPASRLFFPDRRTARAAEAPFGAGRLADAVEAALPPGRRAGRREAADRIAAGSRLLMFAPGERVVLPAWCGGYLLFLVSGNAVAETGPGGILGLSAVPPALPIQRIGRSATLRRTADALASYIGPYAEHAVGEAAEGTSSLRDLRARVAREIEDPVHRERFLADLGEEEEAMIGPGRLLRVRRDPAGRLCSAPPARAADEFVVLAVPPALAGDLLGAAEDDAPRAPEADPGQAARAAPSGVAGD